MIRIVCQENDIGTAANVGGPVTTTVRTFDLDAPELEAWLRGEQQWIVRRAIGVELLPRKEGMG